MTARLYQNLRKRAVCAPMYTYQTFTLLLTKWKTFINKSPTVKTYDCLQRHQLTNLLIHQCHPSSTCPAGDAMVPQACEPQAAWKQLFCCTEMQVCEQTIMSCLYLKFWLVVYCGFLALILIFKNTELNSYLSWLLRFFVLPPPLNSVRKVNASLTSS